MLIQIIPSVDRVDVFLPSFRCFFEPREVLIKSVLHNDTSHRYFYLVRADKHFMRVEMRPVENETFLHIKEGFDPESVSFDQRDTYRWIADTDCIVLQEDNRCMARNLLRR